MPTGSHALTPAHGTVVAALIALLVWSPFPLGGSIPWAWALQTAFVAALFIAWYCLPKVGAGLREAPIGVSLVLAFAALGWALIQILPVTPAAWAHPVWQMASDLLHKPLPGTISISPWRTEEEILKLVGYLIAALLAHRMALHRHYAERLLNGVIFIGAFYGLYAFVMAFLGMGQVNVFYDVPGYRNLVSGPFMLHNSYCTFSALAALAALVKLVHDAEQLTPSTERRISLLNVVQFASGRGALLLSATVLNFAGVIASASRGGFAAFLCGAAVVVVGFLFTGSRLVRQRGVKGALWRSLVAMAFVLPLFAIIAMQGDTLSFRLNQLVDAGYNDELRVALRSASLRMIAGAPWLGLGLGTFEASYPLYATGAFPYVLDRAHCDWLEFIAGMGIPAAAAWLLAIAWLNGICLRALWTRKRDRHYALLAVAASVLIAVHETVDFSLQLPAVALLYAVLLGLGCGQSQSSKQSSAHQHLRSSNSIGSSRKVTVSRF